MRAWLVIVCWGAIWGAARLAAAEAPLSASAPTNRWAGDVAKLVAQTSRLDPAPGGVVFVGSSSIRLWDLEQSFPDLPLINHGFGGAHQADVNLAMDALVLPWRPRLVVLYAGDNDLSSGKSPEEVSHDYCEFRQRLREELPETTVVYLAIKPSPARKKWRDQQRRANQLIREMLESNPGDQYFDTVTPLIDSDGQPRPELFLKDRLHLNREGYCAWATGLRPLLPAAPLLSTNRN